MTQPSAPPAPASAPPPKRNDTQSSVKETIESILVAFILAFIFRAFLVEAFVIPTGSMAPTLLGAHMRFRCKDCGYRFDVNYNPSTPSGDLLVPSYSGLDYKVFCPNCGFRFSTIDRTDPETSASKPPVHYGDRILVLKYLYLLEEPQRWDVCVFKSPDREPNFAPPTYTQNYIKRLIGKPGESVMILDGDIYVGEPAADKTTYQIQTKPRYAQSALWRIIYDNDYPPTGAYRGDEAKWRQPWTIRDGQGWDLEGKTANNRRFFRFDNQAGESTLFFDREANANNAFTDWLAYDAESIPPPQGYSPPTLYPVHDLKVSFDYERSAGDGPLRITLSDGRQKFVAVITATEASLLQVNGAGETRIGSMRISAGPGKDPIRIELANADYQVTLRVDDKEVARTTRDQYHPDMSKLLADYLADRPQPWPGVEISAANQTAHLSHIGLWRDVYYLNGGSRSSFTGSPRNPLNLSEDEFFVLGDNSLVSSDARYWNVEIRVPADRMQVPAGRVPARFMLGRAFFVYWPAGFRPAGGFPAIAPNFGDMRFIR